MNTKKELYELLRRSGAVNISSLDKSQLMRVLSLAKQGKIPDKYLPKLKVGSPCVSDVRCYSKMCKKNTCVSKSKPSKALKASKPTPNKRPAVSPKATKPKTVKRPLMSSNVVDFDPEIQALAKRENVSVTKTVRHIISQITNLTIASIMKDVKSNIITNVDIMDAIRRLMPNWIGAHAVSAGTSTLGHWESNGNPRNPAISSKVKKLMERHTEKKIEQSATVFLTGSVIYLLEELLEVSNNFTMGDGEITPELFRAAMEDDRDMKVFLVNLKVKISNNRLMRNK